MQPSIASWYTPARPLELSAAQAESHAAFGCGPTICQCAFSFCKPGMPGSEPVVQPRSLRGSRSDLLLSLEQLQSLCHVAPSPAALWTSHPWVLEQAVPSQLLLSHCYGPPLPAGTVCPSQGAAAVQMPLILCTFCSAAVPAAAASQQYVFSPPNQLACSRLPQHGHSALAGCAGWPAACPLL